MPRKSYHKSLAEGNHGEKVVRRLFDDAGVKNNKNPETKDRGVMLLWDLEASLPGTTKSFTVEVKYDRMAAKTGNLAVEYFNVKQCKPSGIKATTADLWVVVLSEPDSVWACRSIDLLNYFNNKPCVRDIACGGDDNAAMRLYRKDDILEAVFVRIDGLTSAGLIDAIEKLLLPPSQVAERG